MGLDKIERPNTKWVFQNFFNHDVKAVLDRQLLVGIGPLPVWLRNLAHGRAMVALDTLRDNLCLWRCIWIYRSASGNYVWVTALSREGGLRHAAHTSGERAAPNQTGLNFSVKDRDYDWCNANSESITNSTLSRTVPMLQLTHSRSLSTALSL